MSIQQTKTNLMIEQIFSRKMLICLFTGFTSGLPLYFLISLIPAWLRSESVSLAVIGYFSMFTVAYTFKFLWAPLLDVISLPFLGKRRGWMLLTQVLLLVSMSLYAYLSPEHNILLIGILTALLAFFSASQDIVLDAYRREIVTDEELGLSNTIHVTAYRIASLVPGTLALLLSDMTSWHNVFLITALFMLPGIFMTVFLAKEDKIAENISYELEPNIKDKFRKAEPNIIKPFLDIFSRRGIQQAILIILFIFLYKLGDSMATALATPFYMDMGFTKGQIGLVGKSASLLPMIISGIIGGIWMLRLGINKALWLFGLVQIITILGFMWLAKMGPFPVVGSNQLQFLALVIGAEAIGVGLGTAAFLAFIARETNPIYAATQFALFTSIAALPRTFMNSLTGILIENLGYADFFGLCFLLGIPGMILLIKVAPWNGEKQTKTP